MCYCRFFLCLFAYCFSFFLLRSPGTGRVCSPRSDPGSTRLRPWLRPLIYRLDPFQGPRDPIPRDALGKRWRSEWEIAIVAINRDSTPLNLPLLDPPLSPKQAFQRPVNRIGRPRVICSVVDWSSANLDRAYLERSWRLFITNATISLDPVSAARRIYCKETTGIGRLQCCCSCNVREQTACTFYFRYAVSPSMRMRRLGGGWTS